MKRLLKISLACIFIAGLSLTTFSQVKDKAYKVMLSSMLDESVPFIQTDSLKHLMNSGSNIHLLDTRAKDEHRISHLPDARYVGYKNFSMEGLKNISKDDTIITYCSVGYRSEKIGERLQKNGYKYVFNLYGGLFQWMNEGYEVVNPRGQETDSVHAHSYSWGIWLNKGIKVYE